MLLIFCVNYSRYIFETTYRLLSYCFTAFVGFQYHVFHKFLNLLQTDKSYFWNYFLDQVFVCVSEGTSNFNATKALEDVWKCSLQER